MSEITGVLESRDDPVRVADAVGERDAPFDFEADLVCSCGDRDKIDEAVPVLDDDGLRVIDDVDEPERDLKAEAVGVMLGSMLLEARAEAEPVELTVDVRVDILENEDVADTDDVRDARVDDVIVGDSDVVFDDVVDDVLVLELDVDFETETEEVAVGDCIDELLRRGVEEAEREG